MAFRFKRIGVDLDNTLIDYTLSYQHLARELSLSALADDRESIRKLLRVNPPEDYEWQRFQARLYTEGLKQAKVAEGARKFLTDFTSQGGQVSLVSHKTKFSHTFDDSGQYPLHQLALDFLSRNLITPSLIRRENIYFEPTENRKVERIASLKLDCFLDDHLGVLNHTKFNSSTERYWYSSEHLEIKPEHKRVKTWEDFYAALFYE